MVILVIITNSLRPGCDFSASRVFDLWDAPANLVWQGGNSNTIWDLAATGELDQ